MKSKQLIKFSKFKILAICFLLIAGIIYYYEEIKQTNIEIQTTDVIVAVSDISENEIITKDMIITEKRYAEDVMKYENIATTEDEVIGKRTIVPLYKGEPINNDRLLVNQEYMNKMDHTQIAIGLTEIDKALELRAGDYIDIWLEPVSQNQDQIVIEPYKLIQKIQIIEIHDSNYNNIEKEKKTVLGDSIATSDTVYVPAYITIELSDEALKEMYSVDKNLYTIRVTRYGEEKFYGVVNSIIKGVE